MKYLALLCLSLSFVNNVQSVIFPNKEFSIVKNEGFLTHLVHPASFKLTKCSLQLEDGTSFDLDPIVKEPFIYNTSEGVLIQRFDQESCGVRVRNIASSMSGLWKLLAESDRKEKDEDTFTLNILSNKLDPSPRVITVTQENPSLSVACPNSKTARYCRVDYKGKFIDNNNGQCEPHVMSYGNETIYNCRTMRWGQMTEIESAIKIVKEESSSVQSKGKIIETDKHVILSCQDQTGMCRAEMPGKVKQLMLMEGLLMDHYSTYDTHLNKGKCSLEIEKPLKPEDIGTWRIFHTKEDDSGCVFRLHDDSSIRQSNANDPINIEYWKGKTGSLEITCEVPYPIDYCYLTTPDFPDNKNFTSLTPDKFFKTKYLGICRFVIKQPISGLYVCGVNNINGGEDIQTYYHVKSYEVPVKTSTSLVQGSRGQIIDLMVKTIFDYPMSYCRFMMPNGQVHGVSERFNMTGALRFYGKGLQYGECGIQILKIKESDFGLWKATFKVENKEYSIEMVLSKEAGFTTAYVAGPILAVIAIGGGIFGYFIYTKRSSRRHRRRYERTVGTTTDDLDLDNRSEASHES
ncbi:uncharacterized protein LOC134831550 [Culicoides brevitarsis]|uniref:uncharacterized protein LOC134831550 n=1 Tax=Culicoides brevitarsis TaxID=469753 RepID=UPI00307CC5BB